MGIPPNGWLTSWKIQKSKSQMDETCGDPYFRNPPYSNQVPEPYPMLCGWLTSISSGWRKWSKSVSKPGSSDPKEVASGKHL